MWTIGYRGMFVHGYFDRAAVRWGDVGAWHEAPSLNAAKRAIRKAGRR